MSRNAGTYLTRFIYSGNEQQLTAERKTVWLQPQFPPSRRAAGLWALTASVQASPRRREDVVVLSSSQAAAAAASRDQQLPQDPVRKWRRRGRCRARMLMLVRALSLSLSPLSLSPLSHLITTQRGGSFFHHSRQPHIFFDGMIHGSGDPCRFYSWSCCSRSGLKGACERPLYVK